MTSTTQTSTTQASTTQASTTQASTTQAPDDAALKGRHRAMWAFGDYPSVATDLLPPIAEALVDAVAAGPGMRLLDVAAGSGNVSIPAALAGADVVAADLTPELLEAGRRQAEAVGAALRWEVADAEALPYADGEFDAVVSCVGIMFAPHHQAAADELLRVCRPGGRIALASWTPEGFIGQMFATMKPFVAPPPPGVSPPPRWGDEEYVAQLLGDRVDLVTERRSLTVDRFASAHEFVEFFKARYGPTIAAYRGLADQPDRAAELDRALLALADRYGAVSGRTEWEYLLATATRR